MYGVRRPTNHERPTMSTAQFKRQMPFTTAGQLFNALRIIFIALVGGQVLFLAVVLYLRSNGFEAESPELTRSFQYIVLILGVTMISASHFLYRLQIARGRRESDIVARLGSYYTGTIIRSAMHEGVTLLSLIAVLLTGEMFFIWCAVVVLALLVVTFPSKERAIAELGLSPEESEIVRSDGPLQ